MKKLLGILTVIILLSSCGSSNYLPCPAYGSLTQEEFHAQLECENCDEIN